MARRQATRLEAGQVWVGGGPHLTRKVVELLPDGFGGSAKPYVKYHDGLRVGWCSQSHFSSWRSERGAVLGTAADFDAAVELWLKEIERAT